ncbi:MAG: heavy metal translocating P-type ATPase [Noviherbaspirillum sp.]
MSALPRAEEAGCFHCGLPVPAGSHWQVEIDGADRPMCCPGCAAVAQAIVDHGVADYYRSRSDYAVTAEQDVLPPQLLLYDSAEASAGFRGAEGMLEATLSVDGLRCAACVWLIERRLRQIAGVAAADMNVATGRLFVRWDPAQCRLSDILGAMRGIGYAAYPFDPARHEAQLRRAGKTLGRQLFVAGLCMMQVMMYAVPAYLAADGTLDADMAALMQWASLLLTLPAVCYSARPFFSGAWAALRQRTLSMDVPVALGIGAAFAASVAATVRGSGDVYFDSVTMFIFLLLCSRVLELGARRRAAHALERLQHALPDSAQRLAAYPASRDATTVAAGDLAPGDVILARPGEAIAADAVLLEGETSLDLSLLTGESAPQHRVAGDAVPGGAVNAGQAVLLRVVRHAAASTLATLVRMAEGAGLGKPALAQWADRVAAWFVGGLLLLAAAVFLFWQWHEAARAWPIAIAVLVVSCPCALSLATPSALAAATDALLGRGVLIVRLHVLETLHRASHVVFDKTGTLTMGKPVLQDVGIYNIDGRTHCLQLAAALEAGSAHPIAQALVSAAGAHHLRASGLREVAGQGIEGYIHGVRYRLGRADFVAGPGSRFLAPARVFGVSQVWLGSEAGMLARFDLADGLRADAAEVVARFLAAGKQVILLSGDQQAMAQEVALALGIPVALGGRLPEQKLAFVQQLQRDGAVVAMVGDGINDAAVLRAADVSFAMGSGAVLAQSHADAVLLSGRLAALADAAEGAGAAMAVVRQNLAWAMLYNMVAIPAAAMGWLNPWMSGVGMSLSSMLVVANALRLRRLMKGK